MTGKAALIVEPSNERTPHMANYSGAAQLPKRVTNVINVSGHVNAITA